MKKPRGLLLLLSVAAMVLSLSISGCNKPTEEMKRAEEMIQKAKDAGARDKSDARSYLNSAEDLLDGGKDNMDKWRYNDARDKFKKSYKDAKKAYKLAMKDDVEEPRRPDQPDRPTKKGYDTYSVNRGDCLWYIADKSAVYGDPFQWPLIYDANRNEIDSRAKSSGLPHMREDGWAHWIFPDQTFDVPLKLVHQRHQGRRRRAGAPNPYSPPGR